LTLEEARTCRHAGISGTEAAATQRVPLLARVDATLGRLAPLDERHPELMLALRPHERRRIAGALGQGLSVDAAGSWIGAGGPIDDMYAWVMSGAHPREALRRAAQGCSPPAAGVAASYRTAGFTLDEAWPWLQLSIPPRRAWAYHSRGICPQEAAFFIAVGVTPERARRIGWPGPDLPPSSREPSRDARTGWTPEELTYRHVTELRQILRQDLRVVPLGETPAELHDQILAEQALPIYRGIVRWVTNGADEVILYDPGAARRATRIVSQLEKIASWRDLGRLVKRGAPAGQEALDYLWDEWCGGRLTAKGSLPNAIASPRDLLDSMPGGAAVQVTNRTDDGTFRFIDPYDPLQMGVPTLVVQRYGVERSNLVNYRTVLLQQDLASIRSTLEALGWRLRRGAEDDLARLRWSSSGLYQP
jgi:hypothetical protein